jgi:hypothetical protein
LLLQEEVLRAIIQSGDKITAEEEKFLNQISAKNSSFVQVADNAGILYPINRFNGPKLMFILAGLSEQAIKTATSNFCSFNK